MTNPGTFYSGDDQWRTPSEPTWSSDNPAPYQPPYYLTMSVGESDPAFTLYSTYIPSGADAPNVLYGYLSVNADAGSTAGEVSESVGQLTLQQLPKDQSVPGPGQMQNNFNTDNAISVELNILERGATEVMRGDPHGACRRRTALRPAGVPALDRFDLVPCASQDPGGIR